MTTQVPSTHSTKRETFRPRVRRLSPGKFLIESSTHPGVGHTATDTRCSYTGARFGHVCRHMKMVAALEPRFQAWYGQAARQASPTASIDADLAAAERHLAIKRRALADTHPQSDEYAPLLRQVDQAERAVASLDASAMRAA